MNLFLFNLFTEIAISTKNMKIDCNPTQSNKLISALICTIFAQDAKIGYIRQSQASLLLPSFALSLHRIFKRDCPMTQKAKTYMLPVAMATGSLAGYLLPDLTARWSFTSCTIP